MFQLFNIFEKSHISYFGSLILFLLFTIIWRQFKTRKTFVGKCFFLHYGCELNLNFWPRYFKRVLLKVHRIANLRRNICVRNIKTKRWCPIAGDRTLLLFLLCFFVLTNLWKTARTLNNSNTYIADFDYLKCFQIVW